MIGGPVELIGPVPISSVAFRILLFAESRRAGIARRWLFVVINLPVASSCALPLFAWAREVRH